MNIDYDIKKFSKRVSLNY